MTVKYGFREDPENHPRIIPKERNHLVAKCLNLKHKIIFYQLQMREKGLRIQKKKKQHEIHSLKFIRRTGAVTTDTVTEEGHLQESKGKL